MVRRQAERQGPWALVISQNKTLTCGYGGALGGTRTPNLLIRSQMLYPLSYERSPCSISCPARWLRLVPSARARAQRRLRG